METAAAERYGEALDRIRATLTAGDALYVALKNLEHVHEEDYHFCPSCGIANTIDEHRDGCELEAALRGWERAHA